MQFRYNIISNLKWRSDRSRFYIIYFLGCAVDHADIVFILDASGSVGGGNFRKMLDFVKAMVQGLDVGPYATKIGVMTFSETNNQDFHLNRFHDKNSIMNAISKVR